MLWFDIEGILFIWVIVVIIAFLLMRKPLFLVAGAVSAAWLALWLLEYVNLMSSLARSIANIGVAIAFFAIVIVFRDKLTKPISHNAGQNKM